GSETLKENLSDLNQVDYFEVYKRVPCEVTSQHKKSIELFMSKPNGVLMATSHESLASILRLVQSISSELFQAIQSKKIIVFSERIKILAEEVGFKKIEVTDNPSDEDLVNLLLNKKY
ncbi:MAG: uroporphyrinogen-III synthase, partial [Candidatus Pseudothioglobus sp.]